VTSRTLRLIRITSLFLICILAGFYASILVWNGEPDTAPPQARSVKFVGGLPDFSLADLNGDLRSISEWSGRPLIINFWATWCAPCRREMPLLQALHQERQGDPLAVIGIAIDRFDAASAYIHESGITYQILAGEQDAMEVAEQFGPDFLALPFTVFTAPDGQVLLLHSGEIHTDELREIVAISDRVARGQLTVDQARQTLTGPPG
jgi:thiol-disulfide isomerase/thioredoxin